MNVTDIEIPIKFLLEYLKKDFSLRGRTMLKWKLMK
jgi:hypothetical protein